MLHVVFKANEFVKFPKTNYIQKDKRNEGNEKESWGVSANSGVAVDPDLFAGNKYPGQS